MSEFVHLNDVSVEFFWQLKMDKVFDRGKEYHLIPGLSSFINSSRDNFDTNTSYVTVGTGFTFMAAYYDNFNSKLMAELVYCFILLYECSNVSLFVKEGDSHDINQLFEQRPQQRHIPWTFVLLQVPRQRESGTFFCASVILVWVPTGDYSVTSRPVTNLSSRNTWFAHVLGRKAEEIFFLQLPCDLLEMLEVDLLCSMCVIKCDRTRLPVLHSTSACPWSVQVLDIKGATKIFLQFKCELLEVFTMCLILLDAHTKISVHDLLLDYGYGFKLWRRNSRVMATYNGKFVYDFVFKFGYSLRLLCARSATILFVQGDETGVVCKLQNTRLQHGTVLWSRLILQVTGTNAAGTMIELFDQLHHSRWSFCNLLISQLGNGSRNSLNFCVVASQYAGESQILSKRLHYKLVFLSLRASQMRDVPLILFTPNYLLLKYFGGL
ncbi:uncharacterized protein LOC113297372 [Papaver somniferum]|uniref:uncharacterized protein LOC113297372 n=1 Tax=Papaver somniferum TaxID=3469 RepID=UPI000E6FAB50|nr:uncharacterized protein LOC113297372 [Papaver somniferum]